MSSSVDSPLCMLDYVFTFVALFLQNELSPLCLSLSSICKWPFKSLYLRFISWWNILQITISKDVIKNYRQRRISWLRRLSMFFSGIWWIVDVNFIAICWPSKFVKCLSFLVSCLDGDIFCDTKVKWKVGFFNLMSIWQETDDVQMMLLIYLMKHLHVSVVNYTRWLMSNKYCYWNNLWTTTDLLESAVPLSSLSTREHWHLFFLLNGTYSIIDHQPLSELYQ